MTQLAAFVASGGRITLGGREFTLGGVAEDGESKVVTFRGPRTTYTGVMCVNVTLPGKPGAEVWSNAVLPGKLGAEAGSIVGSRRTVGSFAIHQGQFIPLK